MKLTITNDGLNDLVLTNEELDLVMLSLVRKIVSCCDSPYEEAREVADKAKTLKDKLAKQFYNKGEN